MALPRELTDLYPVDSIISVLVSCNPKKQGSKARVRFDAYEGSGTIGEYIQKGGNYQDLAHDIGRQFVKVTVL